MIDRYLVVGMARVVGRCFDDGPTPDEADSGTVADLHAVRTRTITPESDFREGVDLYYGAMALGFLGIGVLGPLAVIGLGAALYTAFGWLLPSGLILSFAGFAVLGATLTGWHYFRLLRALTAGSPTARPEHYENGVLLDGLLLLAAFACAFIP